MNEPEAAAAPAAPPAGGLVGLLLLLLCVCVSLAILAQRRHMLFGHLDGNAYIWVLHGFSKHRKSVELGFPNLSPQDNPV